VNSYWDMVASFILHGVLNDELFFFRRGQRDDVVFAKVQLS